MSARHHYWTLVISAALILAVTMGLRNALGLFVSPLNTSTGLGIVTISFALAVGQFVWGAAQPIFGALADRAGPVRIIVLGAVLLALGLAVTPFMHSSLGLILFLGVVTAAPMSIEKLPPPAPAAVTTPRNRIRPRLECMNGVTASPSASSTAPRMMILTGPARSASAPKMGWAAPHTN